MNAQSKWFVVTGASNGIGYETALQLSKEPGVQVLAIARSKEKLENLQKVAGSTLHTLVFDLEKDDPANLLKWFTNQGIDTLHGIIHNAGYLVNKDFTSIRKEDLEKSYQVNVFAPFLITQGLFSLLKKSGSAHVVHISSIGGVQGSSKFAGLSAYSTSKGALSILTECLAQEFINDSVKVNCLALGAVQTEMLSNAFPGYEAPLKPHEMGEFISWFALNGNRFFNGKILPVALSTP